MEELVIIYTDGACVPNPGKGGWGITMQYKDVIKEFSGHDPLTTNNRMEMQAAIEALSRLKRPCNVKLYSDSKYLIDGFTQWFPNWKKTNRKDYLNKDLWFQLEIAAAPHTIEWAWVKGHSGNPGNERANTLAESAARNCNQI
jgi:ribonuclease HI